MSVFSKAKSYLHGLVVEEALRTRDEHRADRETDTQFNRDNRDEDARFNKGNREADKAQYAQDRKDDTDRRVERRKGFRRRAFAQLAAYVLFVGLVLYGFHMQDVDDRQRCESGALSRQAQRDTINAVYGLAMGFTQPMPNAPPLTEYEKSRQVEIRKQVEAFRTDTLTKVVPNPACYKYGIKN